MTDVPDILPRPDRQLVRRLADEFNSIYSVAERALASLFASYPNNAAREEILLKVVAVNQLYGTQIYAVRELADHIHGLKIDGLLRDGAPEAVDLIASFEIKEGQGDSTRSPRSTVAGTTQTASRSMTASWIQCCGYIGSRQVSRRSSAPTSSAMRSSVGC